MINFANLRQLWKKTTINRTRGLSSFAVFFNFCSTIFHDYLLANAYFVPNNREKQYFVVINRETRQLRLIIVHLTVNNRKIHDY